MKLKLFYYSLLSFFVWIYSLILYLVLKFFLGFSSLFSFPFFLRVATIDFLGIDLVIVLAFFYCNSAFFQLELGFL